MSVTCGSLNTIITMTPQNVFSHTNLTTRGGKIGPARWASPVRPKLGPGWAIKFLARKKSGQIWPGPVWPSPVWPGPARPARIFFALRRQFDQTGPVFRAGWAVKIVARKNRANFGLARFWPGPLLARPSPARPARLPPLLTTQPGVNNESLYSIKGSRGTMHPLFGVCVNRGQQIPQLVMRSPPPPDLGKESQLSNAQSQYTFDVEKTKKFLVKFFTFP